MAIRCAIASIHVHLGVFLHVQAVYLAGVAGGVDAATCRQRAAAGCLLKSLKPIHSVLVSVPTAVVILSRPLLT